MSRGATSCLLGLLLAASVVPRLPLLASADYSFNSDEAVNALVIRHLIAGRELTLFNWDATYFGIVEGLLALPFAAVLGLVPLAFKLGAFAGHLALMVAVFLLGRRLYGAAAGLAAAALLLAFSPQLVQWSTIAAAGYCLIVAWGTLTLLHLDGLATSPSRRGVAGLGFMVGFGLYMYQLYLVYAALLVLGALGALTLWLRRDPRQARDAWRSTLQSGGLLLAGFVLGWAPRLWLLAAGSAGSKRPSYGLVGSLAEARANLSLLVHTCAPALLGINPAGRNELVRAVGPSGQLARVAGLAVVALYAAAWLWGARRSFRRWRQRERIGVEGLLVLLVPLDAALFVLSPNSQGIFANRFLLPAVGALVLLAGGALTAARRNQRDFPRSWPRRRLAMAGSALAGLLLIAYPLVQTAAWAERMGFLTGDLRLVSPPEPLRQVIRYLDSRGIRGAYGEYWLAYKTTMLSGERVIVTPLNGWDRYPPYTRRVDQLGRAAYVFRVDFESMEPLLATVVRRQLQAFENRLEGTSRPYHTARIGPYAVYTGRGDGRLLAPALSLPPVPLARPLARLAAGPAPATVPAGSRLRIAVRATNESDAFWSATGLPLSGFSNRVAVSYRWLDAAGQMVVADGERSLLPRDVRPGESVALIARARAPETPGTYDLSLTLVQENVAWFDQAAGVAVRRRVEVVAPPGPGRPGPSHRP